ncbi:hypothetical protein A3A39_04305 [Candidatus Kaiserbacteria bacterium RIFCSPLOWO2_01_FULL_54_13]|uniref:Glycosyltransferase subfamily 4-like N-terminal domain-containing protein n=1 Tax=Candidatus Kaiserbacteria bacterium RIFCSPLOWO2_01_FULL_54_13 TaxID=1798512 RepID=A0A1F6F3D6_9BACT|nr:MAG: hypothetical protein A3A39_04305 [Candidatus Kaiserbacteria bacterium RIFCSPLOWO2_01_FULL_54_13]
MGSKRVLFFINSLTIGGAERVFVAQANELSKRGFGVHVATMFSDNVLAPKLALPPENLHVLNIASVFDIRGVVQLWKLARRIRPDILYSTLNEANFIARILKIFAPWLTLHTREANMADIKPLLYKLGDMALGIFSRRIFVVSNAVGGSLVSYAPWLKSKIRVIYNGVSVPELTVRSRSAKGAFKLLAIGTLMPKKDFGVLIRAMEHLPARYVLTLGGDGGERASLEALAQRVASSRVVFLGWVSPDKTEALYRSHDVFVLPSKYEGCPNVVSEAQSFALPVVAFDIAGMREFVDDGAGVLVAERSPEALAEALRKLCEIPGLLEAKGRGGYELVKRNREYETQMERFVSLISQ